MYVCVWGQVERDIGGRVAHKKRDAHSTHVHKKRDAHSTHVCISEYTHTYRHRDTYTHTYIQTQGHIHARTFMAMTTRSSRLASEAKSCRLVAVRCVACASTAARNMAW